MGWLEMSGVAHQKSFPQAAPYQESEGQVLYFIQHEKIEKECIDA